MSADWLRRNCLPSILGFCLLCATFWAYRQTLDFGFLNFDDPQYVSSNARVQAGLSVDSIKWALTTSYFSNWHPVVWLSYMLDCELFGPDPAAFHRVNLAFHLANTSLIFLILWKVTGQTFASFIVAGLFALHPLRCESVTWISERKDVLSGFIGLLALAAYHRYSQRPSGWRYAAVTLLLVLGLMTKPILVTWPFIFLLWDFWPGRRIAFPVSPGRIRIVVLEKLVWCAVAAVTSIIALMVQAQVTLQSLPLSARVSNSLVSYVSYLKKSFFPQDLAVFYPHQGTNVERWEVVVSILILMSISGLALLTLKARPYLAVGWFWYLVTLLPVIGLVQIGYQGMADRYTYIPSIGLFVLIVWGLIDLTERHLLARRLLAGIALIIVLPSLTWSTVRQNRYWSDSESLFRHAVEVTSNNYVAHNNLGATLGEKGDFRNAHVHFQRALEIKPDYAEAFYNEGRLLQMTGDTPSAAAYLWGAVRARPYNADYHIALAQTLVSLRKDEQAFQHFREALRIEPHNRDARLGIASYYLAKDEIGKAAAEYEKVLKENPRDVTALVNLGSARALQHRFGEAARMLEIAVRLDPKNLDAHENRGRLFEDLGDFEHAAASYREAKRLAPDRASLSESLNRAEKAAAQGTATATNK